MPVEATSSQISRDKVTSAADVPEFPFPPLPAEAYQLLCDLGSDVGESVFSDIHQVASLCKVQTADKKHLELVLGLRKSRSPVIKALERADLLNFGPFSEAFFTAGTFFYRSCRFEDGDLS
eukprot:s2746_g4.t1